MKLGEVIDSAEVSKMQEKIVLTTSFYELEELIDIKPIPRSCYILSTSEPVNEEMQIDFTKLITWLEHYGIPQYYVHGSGHIMPLQLGEALNTIKPMKVFPIHGDHPKLFCRYMRNLRGEIQIAERG